MNVFLLVYASGVSFDEVRYFLNARDEIDDWMEAFEGLVCLRSDASTQGITGLFQIYLEKNAKDGKKRSFALVRITDFTYSSLGGFMPRGAWEKILEWGGMEVHWDAPPGKKVVALDR